MPLKQNSRVKAVSIVGACGLLIAVGGRPATAQVSSFSPANYNGRYVCTNASDFDFYTAVIKYNPNGQGGYTAGTMVANDDAFLFGDPTKFCSYTLNTASSFYTLDGHGLGFEKLVWTGAGSNDASCPCAGNTCNGTSSFTDQTAIALRNLTNSNGVVIDAEFSSGNLLDQLSSGHGYCLK
jgi:hypothetical protein